MRVRTQDELPANVWEGEDEILFPITALKYGVRLPLALFVRQFLSDLPLHLLQVSLAL